MYPFINLGSLRTDPEMTVAYSKMGRRDSLVASAAITYPVTSIGLIDGPSTEIEIAQGAILGNVPAAGSKVCALRVGGVGNVHDRDEEGERRNREYEYDHQCQYPCRQLHFLLASHAISYFGCFARGVPTLMSG